MKQLKVAADSPTKKLARAIERIAHKDGSVEILAMGAKAVHKATIAISLANQYIAQRNSHLSCTPYFNDDNEEIKVTSIRYVVGAVKDC